MPKKKSIKLNAVDLFSGCGGLTEGLHQAGFKTKVAIEIDRDAASTYKLNHKRSKVIVKDIRDVSSANILKYLNGEPIHLLAGCPPCQGFSSIRRLNKKANKRDARNSLVLEYLRLVKELRPITIMMENVPGLKDYYLFKQVVRELQLLGYSPEVKIVNVKDYGVPQSRRRLVLMGSLFGNLTVAPATNEKTTVRDYIGDLESILETEDAVHKIIPIHHEKTLERIRLTPKDGGSWRDLPETFILECHKAKDRGFHDIYGRLRWDDYATTITGGCLNPSKGRFLHPQEDRCISAREAALLQSFPREYKFPAGITKQSLALLIGNALPPKFSYQQSKHIKQHIEANSGR